MDTTRQQKISRLVQKELSEIFRRETAKTRGTLVSVSSEKAEAIMESINANEKSIRYELAQQVRYQLRRCPELKFHIDDSLDYIDHIDELLSKDKPKEDSPEDKD